MDVCESWLLVSCVGSSSEKLVFMAVGMATGEVAMGMVVLKRMKEGIISTVGPGDQEKAVYCVIHAFAHFTCKCCPAAQDSRLLRTV